MVAIVSVVLFKYVFGPSVSSAHAEFIRMISMSPALAREKERERDMVIRLRGRRGGAIAGRYSKFFWRLQIPQRSQRPYRLQKRNPSFRTKHPSE